MFHTSQWADLSPGNCAKGAPGELDDVMFEDRSPIPGTKAHSPAGEVLSNYVAAKRMCVGCPLRAQCLEQGMKRENLRHGVWGGLLPGERLLIANPLADNELVRWARYVLRHMGEEAATSVEVSLPAPAPRTCRRGHPYEGNRVADGRTTTCRVCRAASKRAYEARKRLQAA